VAFPLFGKKPAPAPLAAKAAARPAGKGAEPKAATDELGSLDFTHTQDPNSMTSRPRIEVKETIHEIPQAIEQAAMLYSIDQAAAASGALEAAIRSNGLGRYAARAWGMLFELYQIEGRRQDFDRLAVEYAAKFESSPPTWVAGDEPVVAPSRSTSRRSACPARSTPRPRKRSQVFKIAERARPCASRSARSPRSTSTAAVAQRRVQADEEDAQGVRS
jgi:hypothetical protein